MRKWILTLASFGFLLFTPQVHSEIFECPSLELSAGYRLDRLNWNISGVNNHPDVLSELKWSNLQMFQMGLLGQVYICEDWVVRLEGNYGQILTGKVQDSDYDKSHRRGEYSRFICNADRGEVFDVSGSIGYFYPLFCDEFFVTPLVGYSYSEQHLRMGEGHVKILDGERVSINVGELHSNYRTKWRGAWLGFELDYLYDCAWDLYGGFEYHWVRYSGTGHWNLREEFFDDFQHHANGTGYKGYVGVQYCFNHCWLGGFKFSYLDFWTRPGVDRTYILDDSANSEDSFVGQKEYVVETKLNKVNWQSFRAEINIAYTF